MTAPTGPTVDTADTVGSASASDASGTSSSTRRPLDTDRILDAAATMIEVDGAAAFSMRRLAAALDVTPMALYKWFDNREALVDELGARVFDSLELPVDRGGDWNERMLDIALALRAGFIRSRAILPLVSDHRRMDMLMARTADRVLALLAEIDCTGPDAVERFRAYFWTIVGHVFAVDSDRSALDRRASEHLTGAVDAIGADEVPHLADSLKWFTPVDPDAQFTFVMRSLIDGLVADR